MIVTKEIMRNIIHICNIHRRILEKGLDKTGVFQAQHRILMEVAWGNCDSQKEIAAAMKVSTATIAVALKKLESEGYILKEMDEDDNRINHISLTPKGERVVSESENIFDHIENSVFDNFTQEEMEKLYGYIERIENNLVTMEKNIKKQTKITDFLD